MKGQRDTASFVLRFTQDLWKDDVGDPRVEWRGHIRRVKDGEELRFTDITEAMTFIQNSLLDVTMNAVPKEDKNYREKAMRESLKLWEKFAESYTTLFMEAMQRSVKQSEVFQKQVSEAVEQAMKPWWLMGLPMPTVAARTEPVSAPPPPPQPTTSTTEVQLLQTLAALQSQIQQLNDKVDQLETQSPARPAQTRRTRKATEQG
jgi:hypothetical protein